MAIIATSHSIMMNVSFLYQILSLTKQGVVLHAGMISYLSKDHPQFNYKDGWCHIRAVNSNIQQAASMDIDHE